MRHLNGAPTYIKSMAEKKVLRKLTPEQSAAFLERDRVRLSREISELNTMLSTAVGYPYELAHRQLFVLIMALDLDNELFDALPDPDDAAVDQPIDNEARAALAQLVQQAADLKEASRTNASAAEKIALAARFCKLQY